MQKRDGNNGNNGNGGNPPNSNDVYCVGNRVFNKTKLGLDEKEVRAYIDELISERDALSKKQEHLSALAELAEKTIIEANNLANQMKQRATDQAKADTEKSRVKAEQELEHYIKEKKNEAKTLAEKDAELIRTEAFKQAESTHEEQMKVLKAEAKTLTKKVQDDLLASIDSIRQHIVALEPNIEAAASFNYQPTVRVAPEAMKAAAGEAAAEKGGSMDHIPWLEVEVLPPVDIGKIMDLIARLETLPEVKTTDLLPEMPNPLIRVFLNENAPLGELLRTLPQVEKVTEGNTGMISGENRERIQIVLSKSNGFRDKESKKETKTPVVP